MADLPNDATVHRHHNTDHHTTSQHHPRPAPPPTHRSRSVDTPRGGGGGRRGPELDNRRGRPHEDHTGLYNRCHLPDKEGVTGPRGGGGGREEKRGRRGGGEKNLNELLQLLLTESGSGEEGSGSEEGRGFNNTASGAVQSGFEPQPSHYHLQQHLLHSPNNNSSPSTTLPPNWDGTIYCTPILDNQQPSPIGGLQPHPWSPQSPLFPIISPLQPPRDTPPPPSFHLPLFGIPRALGSGVSSSLSSTPPSSSSSSPGAPQECSPVSPGLLLSSTLRRPPLLQRPPLLSQSTNLPIYSTNLNSSPRLPRATDLLYSMAPVPTSSPGHGEDREDDSTPPSTSSSEGVESGDELSLHSQASGCSSSEVDSVGFEPCHITLEERLLKTSPIWYLPELHRLGAVHLLQAQEVGCFIVRQSSKPNTLAITVRLPPSKGPHVEHYLIEVHHNNSAPPTAGGGGGGAAAPPQPPPSLPHDNSPNTVRSSSSTTSSSSSSGVPQSVSYSLEASENMFPSPAALITHYCSCCDELPVTLQLPRRLKEARSRKELQSLALLGQEYWRTAGAATPSTPTVGNNAPSEAPPSSTGAPSRPSELQAVTFSSFGKSCRPSASSNSLLFSPLPSDSTHLPLEDHPSFQEEGHGPLYTPGDRSSLHLNLAPLDDILQNPPTFHSFRSTNTPITPLKPPHRVSPPHAAVPSTPTVLLPHSPSLLQFLNTPTPTSTSSSNKCFQIPITPTSVNSHKSNNNNPPTPPPRWAKSSFSSSSSTITTTLTIPINQVKEVPLNVLEDNPQISDDDRLNASMGVTDPRTIGDSSAVGGAVLDPLLRHREHLDLQIKPSSFVSPQSTPCTPCNQTTPLSTPMSEEGGETRVKMRRTHRDRRRHSNHYHDVNVIDNAQFHRSSLADKISDYEDVWSTPPREIPSIDDSTCPSPKKLTRKMSTFKPNSDMSKSLGDLSDISQSKIVTTVFPFSEAERDHNKECNGDTSFDSITSFRNANSPFYVEPADCLRENENRARIKKTSSSRVLTRKIANRYSDSNIQWKSRHTRQTISKLDQANNKESTSPELNSFENLVNSFHNENDANVCNARPPNGKTNKNIQQSRHYRGKPVAPPRVSSENILSDDQEDRPPWRVDSSWHYQSCDDPSKERPSTGHSGSPSSDARFPLLEGAEDVSLCGDEENGNPGEKTVIEMINEVLPDLPLPDTQSVTLSAITKVSEYDNVAVRNSNGAKVLDMNSNNAAGGGQRHQLAPVSPLGARLSSSVSDSGTEFSEPWDSRKWDSILQTDDESSIEPISLSGTPARPQLEEWDRRLHNEGVRETGGRESGAGSEEDTSSISGMALLPLINMRHLDATVKSRILSPQLLALRHRKDAESGASIRSYSLMLGTDSSSMFAQNIQRFIDCTLEGSERDPEIVVRNVRQFMSGMKNYLVTSGEKQFEDIVKKERGNLKATEFLNMDAILEDVMVRLVLRRLWHHITALYVNAYTSNDSIQRLANNMTFARSLQPQKLGIRVGVSPPKGAALDELKRLLAKMQRVYAPREKLELLLNTISIVYQTLSEASQPFTGDADDLVPQLMWVLSQCGFFSAEIEADYMTGLLLTSSTCGEAKYYLTAFHSAIHALKNLAPSPESTPGNSLDTIKLDTSLLPDAGTLKIIVPDEKNGSIVTRTLPVRPTTTTKEVCKMMAHKMKVTNPQDYGLYKLVDGGESPLHDAECPHSVRTALSGQGIHCILAFKRTDAKIAWPMVNQ